MSTRNFVLPKTWCALNAMKYVGFYPFYRHPEMGLQPVATFRYWILYLGYYFTSSVCINGVCAYILIFEATFEDIKEAYKKAFMESSTDSVALFVCTKRVHESPLFTPRPNFSSGEIWIFQAALCTG